MTRFVRALAALLLVASACRLPGAGATPVPESPITWALAIHGGAGVDVERDHTAELASLRAALDLGAGILAGGGKSLDAVEAVVRALEDDPLFNAGRGAVFNAEGRHQLDAAIMDGKDLRAGGVANLETVRHPITLARRVITDTRHVLLAGAGAEAFADELGRSIERVDNEWFATDYRREAWHQRRGGARGTVGAVARDVRGNLAAATSTGGITDKKHGRVGDSPIVGAGTYADNRGAAVSATGTGEEFIRHGVSFAISYRVRTLGEDVAQATRVLVHETLTPGDGGVIAVGARGRAVAVDNSGGMYAGVADSSGHAKVSIRAEDLEP